jgi:hypothetical protein
VAKEIAEEYDLPLYTTGEDPAVEWLTERIDTALDEARREALKVHIDTIRALAQRKEEQMGDYQKIIAEDDATIARMRERKEWRTVIVGLPTIRKLLNGEDVTLESFKINLIPDDVLFNNRAQRKEE